MSIQEVWGDKIKFDSEIDKGGSHVESGEQEFPEKETPHA